MRLAVVGSRTGVTSKLVWKWLHKYYAEYGPNMTIVSGGAKGADSYAAEFAKAKGIACQVFKPDWDKHGRSAGFKRNHTIWDNADAGIAFWDGDSKGTAHSFEISRKQGKPLTIVLTHEQRVGGINPLDDLEYYSGPEPS